MFSLWVKRLTAFGWWLACVYGAGYFLGRIAPSTVPEYALLCTLLFTGVCAAAVPLILTWLPRRPVSVPRRSEERTTVPPSLSIDGEWEEFLNVHEQELKELAVLPEVIE